MVGFGKVSKNMKAKNVHNRGNSSSIQACWVWKLAGLICAALCTVVCTAKAEEGMVALLYKQFLAGSNSTGFVVFDRTLIYPEPPKHSAMKLPDGVTLAKNPSNHHYYAFCWSGLKYFIASSDDAPLTNENDIMSAKRIEGYDGEYYWRLMIDAVQTYPETIYKPGFVAPIDSASILTLIPRDEKKSMEADRTNENAMLESMVAFFDECRRVTQFGLSAEMMGRPVITGPDTLIVHDASGRQHSAQLMGSTNLPDCVDCNPVNNKAPRYRVSIDSATDTLTIDRFPKRLTAAKPSVVISYKVLAVHMPNLAKDDSIFAWQSYTAKVGKIDAQLIKKGETWSATITKDNQVVPGEVQVQVEDKVAPGIKH